MLRAARQCPFLTYLLIAIAAAGCSLEDDVELLPPSTQEFPKPMRPVYNTGDRGALTYWNSIRNQYTSVFGITAAPEYPVVAPAEFSNKQALILTWTGEFTDVFAAILQAARPVTTVWVVHDGGYARQVFQQRMQQRGVSTHGLQYLDLPLDTMWVRDFGPISVVEPNTGRVGFVDARYFDDRLYDDALPTHLAQALGNNVFRMPLEIEGGNFISDGRGTCFTTDTVIWYNSISADRIRDYFRAYFGCVQTIILHSLDGEPTGHIDMFAKLADPTTMVLGEYQPFEDATNAAILAANAQILEDVVLTDGSPLSVVRMPMPHNSDGFFRSYINSQFINGVLIMPTYRDDRRYENVARHRWQSVMPGWQLRTVDATEIITWAGAVHCVLNDVATGALSQFQASPVGICQSVACAPNTASLVPQCSTSVQGVCGGNQARWCEAGQTRAENCDSCGWRASQGRMGCVGSSTAASFTPSTSAAPTSSNPSACGAITGVGCCDGTVLKYCSSQGTLAQYQCSAGCGWLSARGWYDCGVHGSDPSGQHPRACQ